MSVGTKVGLGPGHTVSDGDPAIPTERGTAVPQLLRPMSIVAKLSSVSAAAELLLQYQLIVLSLFNCEQKQCCLEHGGHNHP